MRTDLDETFPRLAQAPIVEAVIDVWAKSGVRWEQAQFEPLFKARLPEYPTVQPQRRRSHTATGQIETMIEQASPEFGWWGFIFRTADQSQVAQFHREGFTFSRLAPYGRWEQFAREALRLGQIYFELARPAAIQRLDVRFINRMVLPLEEPRFEDYLTHAPRAPEAFALPVTSFFHQERFGMPEGGYAAQIIRTVQAPEITFPRVAVILDIDVFTTSPIEPLVGVLEQRLAEMRRLKNKLFFASITAKALDTFK